MAIVKCPECSKSLKVNDAVIGKRVRCPGCKKPFVVPGDDEVEAVEEEEQKVPARPRRRAEEDEERPRRSRRRAEEEDDEDEEERPRRPRKRRRRDDDDDEDKTPSSAPMILAILSCVFSCAPLIGYILGRLAVNKANQEIDRLPGKRYRDARKSLQLARTIGIVGMSLSGVFVIIGLVLTLLDKMK